MLNQYYNPVRTIQGQGCARQLEELLKEMALEHKRVLLLMWSEAVAQQPAFAALAAGETEFEVRAQVFKASNPTVEQLFEAYQATKGFLPEAVVAVGGGSIMDVGKTLCCLYGKELSSPDGLRQVIQEKAYGHPAARWIGVPTTAGTGSETTCWATIWDPALDVKRSVECRENYAWAALVDPELTEGMPLGLAVSSALDALAHGVESYWANGTNCVSRALALGAIEVILGGLEGLLAGEGQARDAMARGSMLAGLAFSNTRTTACHSISYPLTMHYGIPHGAAVSLLLAPVLALNLPVIRDSERLMTALGAAEPEQFGARVQDILRRAKLPASLEEWGVPAEALPHMAQLGLTKGRADNNPYPLTEKTVLSILEGIYHID